MSSSDDGEEVVPQSVTEYYLEDGHGEPISFAELPVQWNEGEISGRKRGDIVLRGKIDDGIQRIYIPVSAWKFDLSKEKLKIFVLSKSCWVKLETPKKSYAQDFVRTILITLYVLHFLRNKPGSSSKALWDHLSQVYRCEPRPSKDDLAEHLDLIVEAVKKDKILAKSKFVVTLLGKKAKKNKVFHEDAKTTRMPGFINGDMTMDVECDCSSSDDDGNDEEGKGVCDICDDGGNILRCEGECLRTFHPTVEDNCESLGYDSDEVEAICNFFCENCKKKQHQCFVCGKLGSSDKDSAAAEVFRCISGECGRFYHPICVSKLLHWDSEAEALLLKDKIAKGASFTCPIHKCSVCNQGETENDDQLRFAMCRRCPKSYHRKCLPREISFEAVKDEGILLRAWDTLLPKRRILIYCLDHEIDEYLGTPTRNHVKFPPKKKKQQQASEVLSCGEDAELNKKIPPGAKVAIRKKAFVTSPVGKDNMSPALKRNTCTSARPNSSKKHEGRDNSHMPLNKRCLNVKSSLEEENMLPTLNAESERSILALIKDVSSSITLEDVYTRHKRLTSMANSIQNAVDKITLGKVQGSIEALLAALQKIEEGCSIQDAKAVCGPGLLGQMIQWKAKLIAYLAPFLLGMCHTSQDRHFTKSDKLQKIVDILHCYVEENDMIVDFSCGANEFSCLMKKKLDDVGKKCSYKNYDIIYPKNDIDFEKRNWMSVHPSELFPGSQLIIGLNPPFGVDATRANQFINKALEFKPKLIVLIVPSETERLDRKHPPYDLVFEDNQLLTGKAFYLPGSMAVNDEQIEQQNIHTPSLYLWSRQDWTAKHKAIAQLLGHLSRGQGVSRTIESENEIIGSFKELENKRLNRKRKRGRQYKEKLRKELGVVSADDNKQIGSLLSPSQPIETPSDTTIVDKSNKPFEIASSGTRHCRAVYGCTQEEDVYRKDGSVTENKDQHILESNKNLSEHFSNDREQCLDIVSRPSVDDTPCQRSSNVVGPDTMFSTPDNFGADDNRMNASTVKQPVHMFTESNHARENVRLEALVRLDSLGFAPGPCRTYLANNSAGWLDE